MGLSGSLSVRQSPPIGTKGGVAVQHSFLEDLGHGDERARAWLGGGNELSKHVNLGRGRSGSRELKVG